MRLYLLHAAYEPLHEEINRQPQDPLRLIQIIAKNEAGQTVLVVIDDWLPYGYVKAPASASGSLGAWAKKQKSEFSNVASVEIVRRKQFVGFTNLKVEAYAMLRFRRWPVWKGEEKGLLEFSVKPMHKFFHEIKVKSGMWFDVENPKYYSVDDQELMSRCKIQVHCKMEDLTALPDISLPPRLTAMAYDLETTGLDPATSKIHQVCLIFWNTADGGVPETGKDPRSIVICTQPTAEVNGTRIIVVDNERDLMLRMRDHVLTHDPDIMIGYNLSFDNMMLNARSKQYGNMTKFFDIGRLQHVTSSFRISILQSAAMGTNERTLWSISGRWVLDLFLYAKANFLGEPSYKLDAIGKKYVQEGKVEMPWGTIIQAFQDEDAVDLRGEVAHYCEIDGRLCLQLMKEWAAHISCLEEASVSAVNASTIVDTGKQCKVVSLVQSEIYGEWVFNTPPPAGDGKYEGATVIDTHKGYYGRGDEQVILLDFASLYPNLMITNGVCPSRYVRSNVNAEVEASLETGVTVITHKISDTKTVQLATPSGNKEPPVFARILKKLLAARAQVRKSMKTETNADQLVVLDARQKAKKVACNSAYGILGTTTGMLPLPDLAAVTTYTGRMALQFSKKLAEDKYGAFVVGGDTDSIFFTIPHPDPVPDNPDEQWLNERMKYVFEKADIIAEDITARLAEMYAPNCTLDMEFEGVMFPSLYLKKKNYAAVLWNPVKPGNDPVPETKLKIKGLVAVRNDWAKLTKTLANDVLRMAIKERNPEGALLHLRAKLADMRAGRLPIELFIITKELHSYAPKVKSAHTIMCQRIRAADPSAAPALGTKVSYVIRKGAEDMSDRAYPPNEVEPADIDVNFYFDRQVIKPMTEILAPLIQGGKTKLIRMLTNENSGQAEITSLFKRKVNNAADGVVSIKRQKTTAPDDETNKASPKQQKQLNLLTMFGFNRVSPIAVPKVVRKKAVSESVCKTKDISKFFVVKTQK